jgi:hypothetical protein
MLENERRTKEDFMTIKLTRWKGGCQQGKDLGDVSRWSLNFQTLGVTIREVPF